MVQSFVGNGITREYNNPFMWDKGLNKAAGYRWFIKLPPGEMSSKDIFWKQVMAMEEVIVREFSKAVWRQNIFVGKVKNV